MRNLIFGALLLAAILMSFVPASAQLIQIRTTIPVLNGVHFDNDAGDTSNALEIRYGGNEDLLKYAYPDSMRLDWDAYDLGDTNINIQVSYRTRLHGENGWGAYTVVDTIDGGGNGGETLLASVWKHKDAIKVRALALSTGNASVDTRSTLWLRLTRYFHR